LYIHRNHCVPTNRRISFLKYKGTTFTLYIVCFELKNLDPTPPFVYCLFFKRQKLRIGKYLHSIKKYERFHKKVQTFSRKSTDVFSEKYLRFYFIVVKAV